jgi:hypothetical protein
MIEVIPQVRKNERLLHEIAFSVYFPLLLIMVNTLSSVEHPATNSWVDRLYLLVKGTSHPQFYDGRAHRLAFALLWGASATVLFLCVWMLSRFSFGGPFLRTVGGIVAVAGFPLASGYLTSRGYLHMFGSLPRALLYAYAPNNWLTVEVLASLVCIFLYAFRKWPTSVGYGLFLLCLHFAIWTWLVRGQPSLIYPILGFFASLAWGLYVHRQETAASYPKV